MEGNPTARAEELCSWVECDITRVKHAVSYLERDLESLQHEIFRLRSIMTGDPRSAAQDLQKPQPPGDKCESSAEGWKRGI
jgi:hypothetical protein